MPTATKASQSTAVAAVFAVAVILSILYIRVNWTFAVGRSSILCQARSLPARDFL